MTREQLLSLIGKGKQTYKDLQIEVSTSVWSTFNNAKTVHVTLYPVNRFSTPARFGGGFIDDVPWHELDVDFPEALQAHIEGDKLEGVVEVLRQDPRRAGSKHDPSRVYHLAFATHDVAFTVDGDTLHVVGVVSA